MIKQIYDLNSSETEIYTKLNEAQLLHYFEPKCGLFIAESPYVISLALDGGYTPFSLLVPSCDVDGSAKPIIERCKDIPVYSVGDDVIKKADKFHMVRGAMCAMYRKKLPSLDSILSNANKAAVLESVENPTNVGAIIRSAAAFDIDAVIIDSLSADPLYRRAVRVSMGTVFQIPFTVTGKGDDIIGALKKHGFTTLAMALSDKSLSVSDPDLKKSQKLAVILGSEGYGLKPETIQKCDHTVKIPMSHGVDSLNVAAASAVAFWELTKK